jgi:HEAT repeat protein
VVLGDNETYFWAMRDVIDEELELFRPRYLDLNMAEEHICRKSIGYPGRSLEQWRDAAVEFARYLRRRGVTTQLATEALFPGWAGGSQYPWTFGKKFPDGYSEFVATFPKDLIFTPWQYWVKTPEEVIETLDLRRQAQTGLAVLMTSVGDNSRHHVAAAAKLKDEYPNILGVQGSCWGGRPLIRDKYPRHPFNVEESIAPLWNLDSPDRSEEFRWETAPGISNWECLLDEDPPESVEEAIGRLKDPAWRVWLYAREQLVAAGLPAAPVLLDAMSKADPSTMTLAKADGEIRDRIEGCLSRNARDARHGRRRGTLDASKVLPFLSDKSEAVRDMAAELVVSCAEDGVKTLNRSMKDPVAAASCIRALGIVKDTSCAKDLIEVLGKGALPARAQAEAARVLGLLGAKEAAGELRKALRPAEDKDIRKDVRKAAMWSLALIGCRDADKEIAAFLEAEDADMRYRAALALTILKSPETKNVEPWLTRDRHSLELAGWVMWRTWKKEDAKRAVEKAVAAQKDESSRKRLEQLAQVFAGTADRSAKY